MKKILSNLLLLIVCIPVTFADKSLTVGDTLTLYFTEIFPHLTEDINTTIIKYSGVGSRSGLRSALQRAVYYGMLPNQAHEIAPDAPMTDRVFLALLKKHFGVQVVGDTSVLTLTDYERYMAPIRKSFSYTVFQAINAPDEANSAEEPLPTRSHLSSISKYYLLEEVYAILHDNYLHADQFQRADLVYGAAEGMVKELGDEYTVFFRPEVSTDFRNSLNSDIVGIGVIIDVDAQGSLLVTDVIRHSPADKSGIVAGDRIVKIDNVPVNTQNGIVDEIGRLRGQQGTEVEVVILSGKIARTLRILRDVVHVKEVDQEVLAGAFHILFGEVSFGSDSIIRDALQAFFVSGKKRLILDLRNNPGGSMAETRNILNFFVGPGNPLVILKYPKSDVVSFATEEPLAKWDQYEIVILINGDTASAAEIIAATLREYYPSNVAILGETSYGKGTVQELINFDDTSLLKYTIARWVTAKNKVSFDRIGITPDRTVVFDRNLWRTQRIDTQLRMAEQYEFRH